MTAHQLSIFDLLPPPQPAPAVLAASIAAEAERATALAARAPHIVGRPSNFRDGPTDQRHFVQSRAYGHHGHILLCSYADPLPIEIEVRGMRMVISFGYGFAVHAMDDPGSPFISETGFRSFTGFTGSALPEDRPHIIAAIERFIDAPAKDGNGLGGKLKPWWPAYALQWRDSLAFALHSDRTDTWAQWGPEKHAQAWADHDARQATRLAAMRRDGINPDDIGPPHHFKGKWPSFAQALL